MDTRHELLIDLLQEVNRNLSEHLRHVLEKYNLPLTTIIIAKHIINEPGITISKLARKTGIAKSHISNIIEELRQKSWIEKSSDPNDHRLQHLFITEKATEHLGLVRAEVRKQISELVSGISELRTAELIEGLKDIRTALELVKEKQE